MVVEAGGLIGGGFIDDNSATKQSY